MSHLIKPWSRGTGRIVYKSHFWAIVFLILALSFLYYTYEYARFIIDDWFPWFQRVIIFEFNHDMNGILFLIPFFYAALIFWWRGALILWLVSIVMISPHIVSFSPDYISLTSNVFFMFIPLIVMIFITLELRWRERERKTLAEREAERQAYMSQIFKAQEDERQRMARELHDDTTQTLLVIANSAQSLLNDECGKISPQVKGQVESIRDTILNVSEDVRRLSLDLRPSILDNMGLLPALRWLVDRLNQENAINAQMVMNGVNRKLPPETDVIVFRLVQEALSNVRRHSKATEVVVNLEFGSETVKIKVQDNGKGFSLPKTISKLTAEGKLGIIGMQERAKFLGGTFAIHSELSKGTSVSTEFRA